MTLILGLILPIVTLTVFLGGMIYRIATWRNLPAPSMTLFPAPLSAPCRFGELLKETFLFKSLLKSDKGLWTLGWTFHAMLALILLGHCRVVTWLPDRLLASLGMTAASTDTMSFLVGTAAGVILLVCLALLLVRRMTVPRVREVSSTGDYAALFLLLAVVLSGDAMRFFAHIDLAQTREYFRGLFTLSVVSFPENGWFTAHFLLGQVLLIYLPFSKVLHLGGIFFSRALLQRP
ncbi:MAG: respiratory nitrate reductase subunit gamma [Planctomycetota bacterium]